MINNNTKEPPWIYTELLKYYSTLSQYEIPYDKILWTYEWIDFRNQIVTRDNYTYQKCKKEKYTNLTEAEKEEIKKGWFSLRSFEMVPYTAKGIESVKRILDSTMMDRDGLILDVHHKYYIKHKLPWEYSQDILQTIVF